MTVVGLITLTLLCTFLTLSEKMNGGVHYVGNPVTNLTIGPLKLTLVFKILLM